MVIYWFSKFYSYAQYYPILNLANIGDLSQFERFLISCVIRTGQILNISEIARDIGVSVPTAKRWLSLLETGHQLYLLYPYYRNIGKRIVKSPKLYFCDPALCSYLLGFNDAETLLRSPYFGNLFETMIITPKHIISLKRMANDLGSRVKTAAIISCSNDNFVVKDNIINYSWENILTV